MRLSPRSVDELLSTHGRHVCERIAARLTREGFTCSVYDVATTWAEGTHEDAALASAILRELEEYGLA